MGSCQRTRLDWWAAGWPLTTDSGRRTDVMRMWGRRASYDKKRRQWWVKKRNGKMEKMAEVLGRKNGDWTVRRCAVSGSAPRRATLTGFGTQRASTQRDQVWSAYAAAPKNGGAVEIKWLKKLSGGKSQSRSTTRENKNLSRDLGSPDGKSKNETLVLIFCSHTPDVTAICVMPLITGQHVIVKEGRRHILYINS